MPGEAKNKIHHAFSEMLQKCNFSLFPLSRGIPQGSLQSWSFLTIHRDHPGFSLLLILPDHLLVYFHTFVMWKVFHVAPWNRHPSFRSVHAEG